MNVKTGFKDLLGNDLFEGDLIALSNIAAFVQANPTLVAKIVGSRPGGIEDKNGQRSSAQLLLKFEISISQPRPGQVPQVIKVVNPASDKVIESVLTQ